MKKEVDDYLDVRITCDLEAHSGDTLDSFLERITKKISKIKKDHIKDYHTRHKIYKDEYGYDGAYNLILSLYRLETDEEYQDRLEYERELKERALAKKQKNLEKKLKQKEKIEAEERAELARLQEKYKN
jgi:hypothetical protein